MPCSSRIINVVLPEVHTMEKDDSLKPIIHPQIILFPVIHRPSSERSQHYVIGTFLGCSQDKHYHNYCVISLCNKKLSGDVLKTNSILFEKRFSRQ